MWINELVKQNDKIKTVEIRTDILGKMTTIWAGNVENVPKLTNTIKSYYKWYDNLEIEV